MNHPGLSDRENEIAALVARGVRSKGIAQELGLSAYTVNSYLRRIFAKLGVTNRAGMVAKLLNQGRDVEDESVRCPHCGGKLA